MPAIKIVKGDLLDQQVEVIVNAWNRNAIPWWLLLPQGVSGAIKKRAGSQPFRELPKFRLIPLGGAVVTSAGKLPFKAIIHVAGINLCWCATQKSIHDSVVNALKLAQEKKFRSVAFPIIGAGSGSFNSDAALKIMQEAAEPYQNDLEIVFVEFAPRARLPTS